jgi:hypothetical protein
VKGNIMDFVIALIGAAAVLVAGLMLLYIVASDAHRCYVPTHPAAPQRVTYIDGAAGLCAPDGVAITSLDRLRASVTMLDRMINTGRSPDGKRSTMAQTTAVADAFASQQTSPDVTAAQLARCDEGLLTKHAHGYWLLSSALVREAAKRRGTVPASAAGAR